VVKRRLSVKNEYKGRTGDSSYLLRNKTVQMKRVSKFIERRPVLFGTVSAIALLVMGAAFYSVARASTHPAMTKMPAVSVSVQTVNPQNVRIWTAFTGRMQAVDDAQIRPEVSGRITDIRFKDGQTVKAGTILFVIDSSPYEAAVAKAQADFDSANTSAGLAKVEFDRATNLLQEQAITQSFYDQRANAYNVAKDAVVSAQAELKLANIDLDHAYVKAPITGRISRAEITLGNLVQAGSGAPVLASIVSTNGIYADFDVDEQTYIKSIHDHANTHDKERQIPVELTVQGDEANPYKGKIYSFDNQIDTSSGTIRARAKFDNPDGSLVPGMFVSVKLASSSESSALLVPERAIGYDQSKTFVYVVGNDLKVAYHEVVLGGQVNDQRIVSSGLQAGDRVIVDGLQHVRPDITVQIQDAAAESNPAP
jgi:membrane fusion protein, multidrug efflux system